MSGPVQLRGGLAALALLAGVAGLAACNGGDKPAPAPGGDASGASGASGASAAAAGTILDVAAATGEHATLRRALDAAGLSETLGGAGPFTLLAPSDAAFASLPAGTLDALLAPAGKDKLSALLTYHVIPGDSSVSSIEAAIAAGGGKAELATVNGAPLTATKDGDTLVLTDTRGGRATVHGPGLTTANGTVLPLDAVLMPE